MAKNVGCLKFDIENAECESIIRILSNYGDTIFWVGNLHITDKLYKRIDITECALDFKKYGNYFSERLRNGNHTFTFWNIDSYCFYKFVTP